MAAKVQKTIVEKLLDQKKIPHNSYEYGDGSGEFMDGKEVADAIGKPYEQVFKTLVCIGPKGNCVFVVPVEKELDLKKAAKARNIKLIWALSLPGKVAPITSAEYVKSTLYNVFKELEIS